MTRRAGLLALAGLVAVPGRAAGQAPRPPREEPPSIRLRRDGSELLALRRAPVPYATLEQLTGEIGRPLPARSRAMRLTRAEPPEQIDYVLCVTREGVLVVGQQVHRFDFVERRYVFERGEIARGYSPVERPGPWTWLLDVPLAREHPLILQLRAEQAGWPVAAVTIDPGGAS